MLDDFDVGIEIAQALGGGLDLVLADAADAEQDLALEVGGRDDVDVRQADRPDARGGEVKRDRAAQSARADAQDLGVEELELPRHADFRQDEVALVAVDLIVIELCDSHVRA